jgi:hypothetical protein
MVAMVRLAYLVYLVGMLSASDNLEAPPFLMHAQFPIARNASRRKYKDRNNG